MSSNNKAIVKDATNEKSRDGNEMSSDDNIEIEVENKQGLSSYNYPKVRLGRVTYN